MADGVLSSVISSEGVVADGVLFNVMLRSYSINRGGRGCPGVVFGPKVPDEVFR